MSEKIYTPVEVAIQVLDKVKELAKAESCAVEKDEQAVEGADQEIKSTKIGKPNKLEAFIEAKKAKKTKQMEKALGMQGATPPAGSPGSSPLAPKAPKMAVPAMGTPNKKV